MPLPEGAVLGTVDVEVVTATDGLADSGTLRFVPSIRHLGVDGAIVVLQVWGRFDDGAASWTWTHVSSSTQAYCTA